jgi:hypothetical protein
MSIIIMSLSVLAARVCLIIAGSSVLDTRLTESLQPNDKSGRRVWLLTLGSFIVFSYSCTSIREIRPEALMSRKTKAKDILRLEKASGESIVFSRGQAGGVVGDSITGIGPDRIPSQD